MERSSKSKECLPRIEFIQELSFYDMHQCRIDINISEWVKIVRILSQKRRNVTVREMMDHLDRSEREMTLSSRTNSSLVLLLFILTFHDRLIAWIYFWSEKKTLLTFVKQQYEEYQIAIALKYTIRHWFFQEYLCDYTIDDQQSRDSKWNQSQYLKGNSVEKDSDQDRIC